MDPILNVIKSHMGTGLVTVLFVLSLFYVAVTEKDRAKRLFFLYVPVFILAFFLCPVSYRIYGRISESVTYYRLLWLIPVTPVIAYAAVCVCSGLKGFKQNLCIAGVAVLIATSGRLMYNDVYMVRAANMYHMPQYVVDICDEIHIEGREVMALVPTEFWQFIRQYDPCVKIPYGRQYLMNVYQEPDDLRDAMNAEVRDPHEIGLLATHRGVHYIVVPQNERFETAPYGYEYYKTIDGYVMYKNIYLSLEVWGQTA